MRIERQDLRFTEPVNLSLKELPRGTKGGTVAECGCNGDCDDNFDIRKLPSDKSK